MRPLSGRSEVPVLPSNSSMSAAEEVKEPVAETPPAPPAAAAGGEGEAEASVEAESTATFEALVHLEEVEVVSGEEDEEVIFKT